MSDPKPLLAILAGVYCFYDRELQRFASKVWIEAMTPYPIEAVEAAFTRHLADPRAGKWLPKPADIIGQLRGDEDEAAVITWGQVLEVARHAGFGKEKLSPAARQAIEGMGGLRAIQTADESQNGFLQKRFVDAFKAIRHREESRPLLVRSHVSVPLLELPTLATSRLQLKAAPSCAVAANVVPKPSNL